MSVQNISLRKLLMLMFLEARPQRSALLRNISEERSRNKKGPDADGGGDFHKAFWADARNHVMGRKDLHGCVVDRIAANSGKSRLYPQLRDGFLRWYNEGRRWTNEPFEIGQALRGQYAFPDLAALVKVDNIMSVRDAQGVERFIYPYFSEAPALSQEAARLGLWLLGQALPDAPLAEIRILDVMRGVTFSIDRQPLHGDEEAEFRARYAALIQQRQGLAQDRAA